MKYVIDIDGTICNGVEGDYENREPFHERIAKINNLYDEGHKIIYFTARGMSSFNAYQSEIKYYTLTRQQLLDWGCKYHELLMGKPSGDVYIDDKGISSDDFFE